MLGRRRRGHGEPAPPSSHGSPTRREGTAAGDVSCGPARAPLPPGTPCARRRRAFPERGGRGATLGGTASTTPRAAGGGAPCPRTGGLPVPRARRAPCMPVSGPGSGGSQAGWTVLPGAHLAVSGGALGSQSRRGAGCSGLQCTGWPHRRDSSGPEVSSVQLRSSEGQCLREGRAAGHAAGLCSHRRGRGGAGREGKAGCGP